MNWHYYKRPKKGKKYKGVYHKKNSYGKDYIFAAICVNGKQICLGHFFTEKKAALAYNKAAIEYFGVHAYLNPV